MTSLPIAPFGKTGHDSTRVIFGAAALGASTVILHHPHQKLFEKINVTSSPPDVFVAAVTEKMPDAEVHYAQPGFSWP